MKAKGKGQAPHEPTPAMRKQVEALAAYGIPQEEICKVVGVSKPTLHKYYRDELDTAMPKANARVAESLFKKATGDGTAAVTAAIFWLKTRAGWKETVVNEHGGIGGGPIQVARVERVIVDPSSNAKD
jgi:DNA-binding XRE family transcriptional regulator